MRYFVIHLRFVLHASALAALLKDDSIISQALRRACPLIFMVVQGYDEFTAEVKNIRIVCIHGQIPRPVPLSQKENLSKIFLACVFYFIQ